MSSDFSEAFSKRTAEVGIDRAAYEVMLADEREKEQRLARLEEQSGRPDAEQD